MTTETKKCYSSLHVGDRFVPLDEFSTNHTQKDGKHNICKTCNNLAAVNRRKANPASYKAGSKKYYEANKQSYVDRKKRDTSTPRGFIVKMLSQARCRAREDNLIFDLAFGDIIIPTTCPVLGIDLFVGGTRQQKDHSPSLDRIDSSKGYTKDNTIVVSWRANKLKSNATPQELQMLAEFYNKEM